MVDVQDSARKRKRSDRDESTFDDHPATTAVRAADLVPDENINVQRAFDQIISQTASAGQLQGAAAADTVAIGAQVDSLQGASVPEHGMGRWLAVRRNWTERKKGVNELPRPTLTASALGGNVYDLLQASLPFVHPIPLADMVAVLVEEWQEGEF